MDFVNKISSSRTFLMGIAMIAILLFHQVWIKWLPFLGFRLCGNMGVDLFYFLSGFGVVYSLQKHSILAFYKRRIKRIVPMCIFVGAIKNILGIYGGEVFYSEDGVGWFTLFGIDLWFLVDLWFFYLFSPLILKVSQKPKLLLVLVLLVAIFSSKISSLGTYFTWGIVRFPAYVLGMLLSLHKINISSRNLRLGVFFVALAVIYKVLFIFKIFNLFELYTFLIFLLGLPSLCFWLMEIIPYIKKIELFSPIEFVGSHSLELYLWHPFVYNFIYNLNLNSYLSFTLSIILSLMLAACSKRLFVKIGL